MGNVMAEPNTDKAVQIYTDGGCRPNPGVGGWAAILVYEDRQRDLSGGERDTTNNRMELTAAVEALRALKRRCAVVLHTDSQYLQQGITSWIPKWKRNHWRRKGRSEVKNVDLWKQLDELTEEHEIEWRWVRGHAGHMYNELCDSMATEAIDRITAGKSEAR
jgi:ribonuclease HI